MFSKTYGETFMAAPQTILPLLESFDGIEPLKQLFWVELNYDRVNESINELPDGTANLVAEPPLRFATGGRDKNFYIIYVRLKTEKLRKTDERQIITHLQTRDPDALYIFSNLAQKQWHFINVKLVREKQEKTEHQSEEKTQRGLFRRITIAPEERLRTAAERIAMLDLEELGEQETFFESRELLTALEIRKGHEDAFDVEKVTEAFFKDYKRVFEKLQSEFSAQTSDAKWSHDSAQQFLSRCLFLYFVQRKRWLGSDQEKDTDFLHTFWEAYRTASRPRDTFVKEWLNVLFFEAFNNRSCGGYRYLPNSIREALQFAPYLNGGLFRKNNFDTDYLVSVSDDLWAEIFGFFEGYNFTIAEDTPLDQEVAVDPEMIGKVYESLVSVEDEERSDAGIFYTPRVEIDLMCRLALVDNLANHIGTEDDKDFFYQALFAFESTEKTEVDDRLAAANLWEPIHKHLTEITVLDPACGSGSFLVGMLHVLDDVQERARCSLGINTESSFERRKSIIGKNLYGVDVKQWACKVAELRLWLALIIDAEIPAAELSVRAEPLLPNFSFNIRHGDSIVQDVGGMNLAQTRSIGSGVPRDMQRKIKNHQAEKHKFYNGAEERQYTEKEDVEAAEHGLFRELLQSRENHLSRNIRATEVWLEDPAEQLTFDEMSVPEDRQLDFETLQKQKELARDKEDRERVRRTLTALSARTTQPFVWDIAFVEVFSQRNGFDIVIENPPYTRQKDIRDLMLPRDESTKADNKKLYKAKLKRSVYQTYQNFFCYQPKKDVKPDKPENAVKYKLDAESGLYIYFYFHGLSLLNPKGTFCTITPNSWLDVGYGKDLQEFLLKRCHLKMVLDNSAKRSFASADVNTVICLIAAPDKVRESNVQYSTCFVNFTVPFEAILDAIIFYEIEKAEGRMPSTPEHRIYQISQQKLLQQGIREQKYEGDKWGGKYLRAPDIYWTLLEKGKEKLVRLGDIAEVRRGFTSGANDFFYLNEERIQKWEIEAEYLKPVIKSPRECKSICIDPSRMQFKLFMCHADKAALTGTAALEYIKWGELQGYHRRSTCKSRARWWQSTNESGNSVFVKEASETSAVFYNPGNYLVDCRLYYADLPKDVLLFLNSAVGAMFFEIYNRTGLGGGARSMMVSDYEDVPILTNANAGEKTVELLLKQISPLFPRKIVNSESEWSNLDAIIFDALDLTTGERDGVYEAVTQLVTTRLQKAKSV
ncbi:hypothetical protein C6496_03330 [Candidatus Poribacteria bacterium]|nr:MAG: hypothetical protein C6496_03330 [Candidatus Poribacteria bacterium]